MVTIKPTDAPAVAELEAELFPDNCMNEKTLAGEIERGGGTVQFEGILVGYLLCRTDEATGLVDILRLGIRPSHQGRGIGGKLLLSVLMHNDDVMLTVRKNNYRAIRFYQKWGFKITAQLKESWVMRITS
jgi:ribosomal protein S18 acetylase RimI-like enzyme